MPDRTCTQCGKPLPADGRFCSHCGAVQTESPPAQGAPSLGATMVDAPRDAMLDKPTQATMFGYSAAALMPPGMKPPSAAPPPPPQPTPAPVAASASAAKRTMIGISASSIPGAPAAAAPPPAAPMPAPPAPAPMNMNAPLNTRGTMLGVARPGIAPLQAGASPAQVSPPVSTSSPIARHGTMLGVAVPGIAPIRSGPPPQGPVQSLPPRSVPPIVPRPAPLVDDEPALGPAPKLARSGVPIAYVAIGIFVLVAAFGVLVALLWKSHPLIVQPKLDGQGHDQLHLQCDNCDDGTVVKLDGAKGAFKAKEADLTLAAPLKVGDNAITLHLERPGRSRDEEVTAVVPIAYRVKADLTGLAGAHPTIVVRVEATPGTDVRVEDKPVTLDANGQGSYAIDVASLAAGWSDEVRLIDRSIPYTIVPKTGTEQKGTLAVRAGIAMLHLDAPGPSLVTESASFKIAGRTVKGGSVTANGQPVPTDADGVFLRIYDVGSLGDTSIEIRADGPQLASRTARFIVKRVAHLADEVKLRDAASSLGHDAIVQDVDGSIGKAAVVDGEVVDARTSGNQVIVVVEDSRCSDSPCIVRVVYGGDQPMARGDRVRVYGHVTRAVAQAGGGKPVPEVQADFLVKGHAHR
jgi:hypothetical protein